MGISNQIQKHSLHIVPENSGNRASLVLYINRIGKRNLNLSPLEDQREPQCCYDTLVMLMCYTEWNTGQVNKQGC